MFEDYLISAPFFGLTWMIFGCDGQAHALFGPASVRDSGLPPERQHDSCRSAG